MEDPKGTLKLLLEKIRDQNKTNLLLQGLQTKFEKEQAGEDNDKREKQLELINENLQKIEKAVSGNSDQIKVLPKDIADNLNIKLSELNVPEEDKTFTESLKEVVGSFKSGLQSLEQGINNSFNKGFKFLSDPLGSIKEGLKNVSAKGKEKVIEAKEYIKDVASTKAGYTAEEGRFVEEYKKQKQPSAFGMTEEQKGALTEKATAGFRQTKDLEEKIKAAEADIEKSKKLGFAAAPQDVQKLEELKKLKADVDVRGDTFTDSVTEAKFKPGVLKEPSSAVPEATTVTPSVQTPVQIPEATTVTPSVQTPVQIPEATTVTPSVQTPVQIPEATTVTPSVQTPVQIPDQKQTQSQIIPSVQTPVQIPEQTSSLQVPEQRLEKVENKQTTNEEADNVVSAQESIADSFKENNELLKDLLTTTKEQLNSIKAIKESLAPNTTDDQETIQQKKEKFYGDVTNKLDEISGKLDNVGSGGGGLLDAAKGLMDIGGGKGKAGPLGKTAGVASRFSKLATIGKVGGAALAVAGGAYTAYEGYTAAEDSKEAKLKDVQAQLESGKIDEKQASQLRNEIGNSATVEKGGALGKGTGMAAGGLAGMKLGATLGSFAGPVGTVVGGLAGGALGAFAGSSLGEKVGELGGNVVNYFKGDKKKEVPAAATQTVPAAPVPTPKPVVTENKVTAPVEKKKPEPTNAAPVPKPVEVKKETKVTSKEDYTKSSEYQKFLLEEQEVIKGRNVRTAGEGREASETLSASQMREAEREAKTRYLEKSGAQKGGSVEPGKKDQVSTAPNVEPAKREPNPLGNLSVEYNDQTREAAQTKPSPAPIIMNNSSSNNTTSYVPMKSTPRPEYTGSALDRYQTRISTY